MKEVQPYNYIETYLDELRSGGRYSFTINELTKTFQLSDNAIKKSLQRLKQKNKVALIRKGFYLIIPPEYSIRGILPPTLFVDDLMNFIQRNYYVGLLNAAVYYGAGHQQPQEFFIITVEPTMRSIVNDKLRINFCYKKNINKEDITKQKTDAGYINISTPELTALDLVFYYDRIGGFNRAVTILDEMIPSLKPDKLVTVAKSFNQIASVQRLGFLLDIILEQHELARPLQEYIKTIKHFPVLLRPQKEKPSSMSSKNSWKVVQNIAVESEA